MTTTQDDELATAIRVVRDAGFDIVVKEQHDRIMAWLRKDGRGMPPAAWRPGLPVMDSRRAYDTSRVLSWERNAERERGW